MPSRFDTVQLMRRFYQEAGVRPVEGGFAVALDGRTPKSPGGVALVLPTEALAGLVAAEWAAQEEYIQFAAMPATRLAFTALEKVADARDAVADEVARYAGSDVLCYFAEHPADLNGRQTAGWGPVLDWAEETLGVRLERAAGIVHRPQPAETLERVRSLAAQSDDFTLAGLAHATALLGSAILALAVQRGRLTGAAAFDLSRLDEAFQEEQWGVDEEAAQRTGALRAEAALMERWFRALDAGAA